MSGEAMPKGMGGDMFVDAGLVGGVADGVLDHSGIHMVAPEYRCANIVGQGGGGKDILPNPVRFGPRIFTSECMG